MPAAVIYRFRGFSAFEKEMATAPELVQTVNRDALGHSVNLVMTLGQEAMPEGPGHFGYHAKEKFSTSVTPLATAGIVDIKAPQALWLEGGTKAHDIKQKSGLVIHHPGEKARHLMKNTLRRASKSIRAFFRDSVREQVQAMADRINSSGFE